MSLLGCWSGRARTKTYIKYKEKEVEDTNLLSGNHVITEEKYVFKEKTNAFLFWPVPFLCVAAVGRIILIGRFPRSSFACENPTTRNANKVVNENP